jgi:hypothetical protein
MLIIVWSLQKFENRSSGFHNSKKFEGFYVLTVNLLTTQSLLRYNSVLMGKGY